jgi:hypothetical protein
MKGTAPRNMRRSRNSSHILNFFRVCIGRQCGFIEKRYRIPAIP